MKTCENCGERVYKYGCVNCNEADYIDMQDEHDAERQQIYEPPEPPLADGRFGYAHPPSVIPERQP